MKLFVASLASFSGLLLTVVAIAQPMSPTQMPFPSDVRQPSRDDDSPAYPELSSEQQAEIDEILGSEKAEELQAAVQDGEDIRSFRADLDLSEDQLDDLNQAFASARQQMIDVAPDQQDNVIRSPQRRPF